MADQPHAIAAARALDDAEPGAVTDVRPVVGHPAQVDDVEASPHGRLRAATELRDQGTLSVVDAAAVVEEARAVAQGEHRAVLAGSSHGQTRPRLLRR